MRLTTVGLTKITKHFKMADNQITERGLQPKHESVTLDPDSQSSSSEQGSSSISEWLRRHKHAEYKRAYRARQKLQLEQGLVATDSESDKRQKQAEYMRAYRAKQKLKLEQEPVTTDSELVERQKQAKYMRDYRAKKKLERRLATPKSRPLTSAEKQRNYRARQKERRGERSDPKQVLHPFELVEIKQETYYEEEENEDFEDENYLIDELKKENEGIDEMYTPKKVILNSIEVNTEIYRKSNEDDKLLLSQIENVNEVSQSKDISTMNNEEEEVDYIWDRSEEHKSDPLALSPKIKEEPILIETVKTNASVISPYTAQSVQYRFQKCHCVFETFDQCAKHLNNCLLFEKSNVPDTCSKGRPFKCSECHFCASTKCQLRKHLNRHVIKLKYKCTQCYFYASNLKKNAGT